MPENIVQCGLGWQKTTFSEFCRSSNDECDDSEDMADEIRSSDPVELCPRSAE